MYGDIPLTCQSYLASGSSAQERPMPRALSPPTSLGYPCRADRWATVVLALGIPTAIHCAATSDYQFCSDSPQAADWAAHSFSIMVTQAIRTRIVDGSFWSLALDELWRRPLVLVKRTISVWWLGLCSARQCASDVPGVCLLGKLRAVPPIDSILKGQKPII